MKSCRLLQHKGAFLLMPSVLIQSLLIVIVVPELMRTAQVYPQSSGCNEKRVLRIRASPHTLEYHASKAAALVARLRCAAGEPYCQALPDVGPKRARLGSELVAAAVEGHCHEGAIANENPA